ncbi:MAG: hypothetical protein IKH45_08795 [Neisseriaceae bacterium]|nr:hypothetical protein [Neisseriaceae bacterium]
MQQHKIDNFLREYPEQQFPQVCKLSEKECLSIKTIIMKNFCKNNEIDYLLNKLTQPENHCGNIDKDGVELIYKLINENTTQDFILIDWGKFDDIDKMAVNDFIKYFDDIWYPVADDIDVFDKSCSWIMRIAHWGDIFVIQANTR